MLLQVAQLPFIEDVLDALIIGAGMWHFGVETIGSMLSWVPLPEEFQCWGEKARTDWLLRQAAWCCAHFSVASPTDWKILTLEVLRSPLRAKIAYTWPLME